MLYDDLKKTYHTKPEGLERLNFAIEAQGQESEDELLLWKGLFCFLVIVLVSFQVSTQFNRIEALPLLPAVGEVVASQGEVIERPVENSKVRYFWVQAEPPKNLH